MATGGVYDLLIFGFRNDVARARTLDFLNRLPPSHAGPTVVDGHTSVPHRLFAALDGERAHKLRLQLEAIGAQVLLVDVSAASPHMVGLHDPTPPARTPSGIRLFTFFLVVILGAATFAWRAILPPARPRLPSSHGQHTTAAAGPAQPSVTDHADAVIADAEPEAAGLGTVPEYAALVDELERVLQGHPDVLAVRWNLQTVLFNWGVTELAGNRFEDAATHLERAAALGERADVLAALGITYAHAGDHERAAPTLEAALRLNPTDPNALLALSQIYLKEDRRPAALELLERAKDAGAHGPELDKLVQQLSREVDAEWDFVQLDSRHFRLSFADNDDRSAVREVLAALEDAYDSVGAKFGYRPSEPTNVVLYTQQDFHAITQTPDWAGGAFDGRIKLPVRGLRDNDPALARIARHEYTHSVVARLGGSRCPVWLNEGLAVWAEEEHEGDRQGWAENAIAGQELFTLDQLAGTFTTLPPARVEVAYAESYLAVRAMVERYGTRKLPALLEALRTHTLDEAFSLTYPGELSDFEQRFLQQLTG
jgi:tetratricopeptide (TPR) repeat protein